MIRIILEVGLHNERSIPACRGGLRLRGPAWQLHPRRGTGLGQVFAWQVRGDIAAGRLQSVLEDWQAPFPGWFVYYPAREHMAPKLRVFIDFMRERLDAGGC